MNYTLLQWFLFLYTYAFLGWIWECCYVSAKSKEWINRGFLHGPLIPIYGFGAIIVLWLTLPFKDSLPHIYILGSLGASTLEYVTGTLMERIFKVRYWDYSHHKFNLHGHISLFVSLGWGLFSVLLIKVLHQPIENVIIKVPYSLAEPIGLILTVTFAVDATISIQSALDMKKLLKQLADNNKLIISLSLKLNDITSSVNQTSNEFHKYIQSIETDIQKEKHSKLHLLELLNNKIDIIKKEIQFQINSTIPSTEKMKLSNIIKDLNEIKGKVIKLELNIASLKDKVYKQTHNLIRRYPTSVSRDFEKTFQEIKSYIESKNTKKKK